MFLWTDKAEFPYPPAFCLQFWLSKWNARGKNECERSFERAKRNLKSTRVTGDYDTFMANIDRFHFWSSKNWQVIEGCQMASNFWSWGVIAIYVSMITTADLTRTKCCVLIVFGKRPKVLPFFSVYLLKWVQFNPFFWILGVFEGGNIKE